MPALSSFYGISIYMYFDDHSPPHYHARYGEYEAWIVIVDGSILMGSLPREPNAWSGPGMRFHEEELLASWERAVTGRPVSTIEPPP